MNFMSKPVSIFSVHIPIFEYYLFFALLKQDTHVSQNLHTTFEKVKKPMFCWGTPFFNGMLKEKQRRNI